MDATKEKACLIILEKMMQRPICSPFLSNGSGKFQFKPLEGENKLTLESIKSNLMNHKYKSVKKFGKQVFLFLSRLKTNCTESFQKLCVSDLKSWFDKRYQKLVKYVDHANGWSKDFNETWNLLNEIHNNPPPFLYGFYENQNNRYQLNSRLLKALEMVNDDVTLSGVFDIVSATEPRIQIDKSGNKRFVLDQCSLQTLQILQTYLEERFKVLRMNFP